MRTELMSLRQRALYDESTLRTANGLLREAIDMSVEDPDHKRFRYVGVGAGELYIGGRYPKELQAEDSLTLRAQCYKMYHENPYVRGIVRTLCKFVFGRGVKLNFVSKKKSNVVLADGYVKAFHKANKWKIKEKEFGRRVFRDGELFAYLRRITKGEPVRLQFIDPDRIGSNDPKASCGIETVPDDVEEVITYRVQRPTVRSELSIPAKQITHVKLGVDSDVKRGRSVLEPILKYATMYENWLSDRMILNKVRTAVALVRTVEGTPTQVRSIRNQQQDTDNPNKERRQKMLRPGTIITASPGVKYEMLSANINAADAAQDGHNVLLSIAAGIGFPEMFLTGDFSNANYSSSLTAQNPFVREFEDYQDLFTAYYIELYTELFELAKELGDLPKDFYVDIEPGWPPLVHRDIMQAVSALSILFQNAIISGRTFATETDHDYDKERKLIKREQEELGSEEVSVGSEEDEFPDENEYENEEDNEESEHVLEHLEGQHDQKAHAGEGRIKVGGRRGFDALSKGGKFWQRQLFNKEVEVIGNYGGSGNEIINYDLRNGKKPGRDAKLLDSALKKSMLPKNITVYRGMELDLKTVFKMKEKGKFRDKGFVSTSLNKSAAMDFTGEFDNAIPVFAKIKLPKGYRAAYLDRILESGEREVLLPRGRAFKITKMRIKKMDHVDTVMITAVPLN